MKQQDLLILIDKYCNGTATDEEQEWLHRYYNSFQQAGGWNASELGVEAETEARILKRLTEAIRPAQAKVFPFHRKAGVKAAAVLVLLISAWWFTKGEKTEGIVRTRQPQKMQVVHERHTILTLADGAVMVLDSTPDGTIVRNENTIISKQGRSITINLPAASGNVPSSGFHTLKIPYGQQFRAVLSDGSQVWLNTASSLRFPAAFGTEERRVEVSGEAFFEVTKDTARPFRVLAVAREKNLPNGTLVEVLGTQFNINAYGDEGLVKTTLLEGSVKVAAAENRYVVPVDAAVLLPGEQAQIDAATDATAVVAIKKADVEEVLAWKSNVFLFNNAGLQSIMQQLARWYDVEVVYANKVPVRHFSGKISRAAPLSTVLEILEQSNIRFRIKGNQIIVKS